MPEEEVGVINGHGSTLSCSATKKEDSKTTDDFVTSHVRSHAQPSSFSYFRNFTLFTGFSPPHFSSQNGKFAVVFGANTRVVESVFTSGASLEKNK